MKTIVIGVMSQEQIRARTFAIAKGDYKPRAGEPKIWFRPVVKATGFRIMAAA